MSKPYIQKCFIDALNKIRVFGLLMDCGGGVVRFPIDDISIYPLPYDQHSELSAMIPVYQTIKISKDWNGSNKVWVKENSRGGGGGVVRLSIYPLPYDQN